MSDFKDDGTLSDEAMQRATQAIDKAWGASTPMCPICKSMKWTLINHLVTPVVLKSGFNLNLGGTVYPQLMLISPCGYTMYMNALALKVVAE